MKKSIEKRKLIAVDFDGVIHAYSKGWQNGAIYDPPVPGAKEALARLREKGYSIMIWTSRAFDRPELDQKNQVEEIQKYLIRHEIPYDSIYTGASKPLCWLFVDDRALGFNGNWDQTVKDITEFSPWTQRS